MGSLLLQQIPLALGIIMSPLAVVAVVAQLDHRVVLANLHIVARQLTAEVGSTLA